MKIIYVSTKIKKKLEDQDTFMYKGKRTKELWNRWVKLRGSILVSPNLQAAMCTLKGARIEKLHGTCRWSARINDKSRLIFTVEQIEDIKEIKEITILKIDKNHTYR